jgi:tetratricopeptide (TPR) repeat protein
MIIAKRIQPDATVEFIPTVIGRMQVSADALTFYVGKVLVPWPLSPSYGRTPVMVVGWRAGDVVWVVPAIIFFVAWRFRRAYPERMVAATIVLSGLAPVLGVIPFKGQNFSTVADRYMYFPLVGVALVVASLATRIRLTHGRQWAAVTVIGVLLTLNVRYQPVWRDETTLWSHAATTYPNQPRVHNNYGAALQAAGSQEEAIGQFNLALQARPDFADAYCNRGNSLGRMHRYSDALSDQTRALDLDATDAGCWYDRAVTLFNLGRFDEALADANRSEKLGGVLPPGFKEAIQARLAGKYNVPR